MLKIANSKVKIFHFVYFVILFCCASFANAVADPVATMQGITDRVLTSLKQNKREIDNNPDTLYTLIYQSVVPHVDFEEISKWVAGRNAWNQANDADKAEFIRQFKLIVVKTYASALKKYSDEKVVFLPLKDPSKISKRMQLSSNVWDSNSKKKIRVDFRIIAYGDSWKVYDLVIEGVSLLKGFQAQFSDLIHNKGVSAAIMKMKQHNASILGDELTNSLLSIS